MYIHDIDMLLFPFFTLLVYIIILSRVHNFFYRLQYSETERMLHVFLNQSLTSHSQVSEDSSPPHQLKLTSPYQWRLTSHHRTYLHYLHEYIFITGCFAFSGQRYNIISDMIISSWQATGCYPSYYCI